MPQQLICGDTISEQMESIEAILQRFRSRLSTKVIGAISPVPIFFSCKRANENGELFSLLVPVSGYIKQAYSYAKKVLKESPTLTVMITTDTASSASKIELKPGLRRYALDWKIDAGSLLEVSLYPADAAEDISIGIALHPFLSDTELKPFLLEEFLALNEQEQKELEEDARIRGQSEQVSPQRITSVSKKRAKR